VLVRGLTFQGDDVNAVVDQAVRNAVKRAGPGVLVSDQPLKIQPPVVVAHDQSTVRMNVHAIAQVVSSVDPARIAAAVRGLTPRAASRLLDSRPGIGRVRVDLWPRWARTLPSFSWRIHVVVGRPTIGAGG
ncbi:MAG: hypothetical protein ACYDAG_10115, partial [Chloroflexota bacterium]